MAATAMEPAVDPATVRPLLAYLCGVDTPQADLDCAYWDDAERAAWLVTQDFAELVQDRSRDRCPALAARLQSAVYRTMAHNALHWENLRAIDDRFAEAGLTAVLFKGAALAGTIYERPELRAMTDVDLWLRRSDMVAACRTMDALGFDNFQLDDRPLALQVLSDGEVKYWNRAQEATLIELHLSPFTGWWLKRAAVVDTAGIWERSEPLPGWTTFAQPDPEDTVIQLAVHLAINHQFGLAALRSLLDIGLTAQVRGVDWDVVTQRARAWRLATTVWLVLSLTQSLTALPGLDKALHDLQPSAVRRKQLQALVSPQMIVAGGDLRSGWKRFLLLLLLVDRARDAAQLVYRTLWPESDWLAARYGGQVSSWQHLRRVVMKGEI